jgi:hypothetical protein
MLIKPLHAPSNNKNLLDFQQDVAECGNTMVIPKQVVQSHSLLSPSYPDAPDYPEALYFTHCNTKYYIITHNTTPQVLDSYSGLLS